jgi:ABC-2 type transport system permease protein
VKREIGAIVAIIGRDVTKLLRDRTRIAASFIFPVIFIGVLGSSLQANLSGELPYNFLTFVFTGVLGQTLFQSTASGIISLVEDRQNDFAQELFVAPVSRYSIIVGKILGEMMVAMVQVMAVVSFGLIIGVPLSLVSLLRLAPVVLVVAALGGSFGLVVMANLSEQRAANQIFPFLLFPQFFLAGVFSPIKVLPLPLLIASRIAPMTYAVDLMRSVYYFGQPEGQHAVLFNPVMNLAVVVGLTVAFLMIGTMMFVRNERNR